MELVTKDLKIGLQSNDDTIDTTKFSVIISLTNGCLSDLTLNSSLGLLLSLWVT